MLMELGIVDDARRESGMRFLRSGLQFPISQGIPEFWWWSVLPKLCLPICST